MDLRYALRRLEASKKAVKSLEAEVPKREVDEYQIRWVRVVSYFDV